MRVLHLLLLFRIKLNKLLCKKIVRNLQEKYKNIFKENVTRQTSVLIQ